MVTINKAKVSTNVWRTIYDRLNSNISSVTTNIKYTDGTYTHPIQSITSSFSDKEKTQKSDYPCLVINPVLLGEEEHTFKQKFRTIRVEIEVFATANIVAGEYMDQVINSLETYRNDLRDLGIRNFVLSDTDNDTFMDRGGIKLHSRTIIFTGRYMYESTQTY